MKAGAGRKGTKEEMRIRRKRTQKEERRRGEEMIDSWTEKERIRRT